MVREPIKPGLKARVGLYSIGHEQYWNQFEGLRDRLIAYGGFIENRLAQWADVYNFGMVDSDGKGRAAGEWFNQHNVDLLICHAATYATSAVHIAVPQICPRPVLVLNLQPAARMHYAATGTGEWLSQCGACGVPEIANAFSRSDIPFHAVNGLLGLDELVWPSLADEVTAAHPDAVQAWNAIEAWVRAAGAVRSLRHGRMGMLGQTYPGMLDMYSDFTMVTAQSGMHVEVLEMCDVARTIETVTPQEKEAKLAETKRFFTLAEDVPADPLAKNPTEEQLDWSCTVAVALDKLVHAHDLDALTYYYRGAPGNAYEKVQEAFILGLSLLTGRGIPCSGEGDMKTAIAMKICDLLDVGGSYCEIVASDFEDQTIIMGHDGPFHIAIARDKPVLRGMGLYHGKWGSGVSVEASVRPGPITNLAVTQTRDGRLAMIVKEGEATTGDVLRIGNTMTPVRFAKGPSALMDEWFALGPTHHFAMSVGHNALLFQKVATLLGWPCHVVAG